MYTYARTHTSTSTSTSTHTHTHTHGLGFRVSGIRFWDTRTTWTQEHITFEGVTGLNPKP